MVQECFASGGGRQVEPSFCENAAEGFPKFSGIMLGPSNETEDYEGSILGPPYVWKLPVLKRLLIKQNEHLTLAKRNLTSPGHSTPFR